MCLEQIRDKAKKFQYRTSQSFLDDVKLIVDNCKLYNGEAHPLSTTANGLLSKAITLLKEVLHSNV
ncbi:hypothetical protein BC833DRAFT_574879 [Globomyces pollinis-pini]|nr:hypothetical protein BC833DRAFT_574879 [Globomyces pollinis-pini]